MTTAIDGFSASPEQYENIAVLWGALSQELAKGSTVTFTIAPAPEPAPQLTLVDDSTVTRRETPQNDPADADEDEAWCLPGSPPSIPRLGKGILLRSAARLCLRWEYGFLSEIVEDVFTEQDVVSFLHSRPEFHESCDFAHRHTDRDLMHRTAVAVAHYGFSQTNGRQSAEQYLIPLATGAGLELHSPALTLRNKLKSYGRQNKTILDNERMLVMLVHTYGLELKGLKVSKLRLPADLTVPPIPRIA